ncbi:hypothetical protein NLG97_g2639 [Lecanicillium saksenae]|uniref:Uncharacterized protein n=1 Tax=Lecanicillium saksenae TaxID=468837 RepID=A0ACC1R3Q8_9HYPO|nr:hypothetical protein NLG97_g2639 [Lecanicillium saksenae]
MSSTAQNSIQEPPTLSASAWIAENETLVSRNGHHISYRRRGRGPTVLLLHGFPTWSYDWVGVAKDLEADHDVVTLDFLGYGASDKPSPYNYSVDKSADIIEDVFALLKISSSHLAAHDYGGIVAQELLDRRRSKRLPFSIKTVAICNSAIVYSAYRPTILQRLLAVPYLGAFLARNTTTDLLRKGFEGAWGKSAPITDEQFENLWHGISLKKGFAISHLLIGYNAERAIHSERWEAALAAWDGPLHLIWGLDDPVSGQHVLDLAVEKYRRVSVTRLEGVGHFPPDEAPLAVSKAIRAAVAAADHEG